MLVRLNASGNPKKKKKIKNFFLFFFLRHSLVKIEINSGSFVAGIKQRFLLALWLTDLLCVKLQDRVFELDAINIEGYLNGKGNHNFAALCYISKVGNEITVPGDERT